MSASAPPDAAPRPVTIQAWAEGPATELDVAKAAPFGWWPAIIIALAAFIDRAEGAVTLGAAASLQNEFGFNDAYLGVLASAPIIASLLLVIPAGRLADRVKRKNMLVVVMCLWGVCTIGAGAAVSLLMFTSFRILLGAATPLNIPPSSSLLGDYYPRRSRTKAFAILRAFENAGLPVGTLIGAVVGGLVGWRIAFFVVAIPALVLAAVLFFTLREPRRGVGDEISVMVNDTTPVDETGLGAEVSADLSQAASSDRVSGPMSASTVVTGVDNILTGTVDQSAAGRKKPGAFRTVFRIPTVRRLVLGQTVLFCAFSGLFAFATLYFAREYFTDDVLFGVTGNRLVPGEAQAIAGFIVAGGGVFPIAIAAILASKLDARYAQTNPERRVSTSIVALLVGFVALAAFVSVPVFGVQLVAFLVFAGVNIIAVSNLSAAIADTLPARLRGTGFSAFQFLLAIGSAAGAGVVGAGSALAGNDLRWGFAALLVPLLIGVFVVSRARASYLGDAQKVLDEAAALRAAGVRAQPAGPPLH